MSENLTGVGMYSRQINIVTTIDVVRVLATGSTEGCVQHVDNAVASAGKGTAALSTVCRPGQVLNWLVYALDGSMRPDGHFPPYARLNNIVFLDPESQYPRGTKVLAQLKTYGAPDRIRSAFTPVYSYWAGIVPTDLPPGDFAYRMCIEVRDPSMGGSRFFDIEGPSLHVTRDVDQG